MRRRAVVERNYNALERYRGLLALACGALGCLGFVWGSFAVLLADLSRSLGLSPGPLGLALSGGTIASFPVMVLSGRVADRAGRRPLLVVSGASMGMGFAWLAFFAYVWSVRSRLVKVERELHSVSRRVGGAKKE